MTKLPFSGLESTLFCALVSGQSFINRSNVDSDNTTTFLQSHVIISTLWSRAGRSRFCHATTVFFFLSLNSVERRFGAFNACSLCVPVLFISFIIVINTLLSLITHENNHTRRTHSGRYCNT